MRRSGTPRRPASGDKDHESISVHVRIRPLLAHEAASGERSAWKTTKDATLTCSDDGAVYSYNNVFPEACSSDEVYKATAHPMVQAAMRGYNGTVFAYGQTVGGQAMHIQLNPPIQLKPQSSAPQSLLA